MTSDRMKQRLVGAAVLIALAVIFIPVLFNLQPPIQMDQQTQIPDPPEITAVSFDEPVVPEIDNEVPDPDTMYDLSAQVVELETAEEVGLRGEISVVEQDDFAEILDVLVSEDPVAERVLPEESAQEVTTTPVVAPSLGESGLPESWLIQVAALSQRGAAQKQVDRLQGAGYKAFYKQGIAEEKQVYRVFVGPFISRNSAEREKQLIDSSLGVKSFILPFET